MLNLFREGSKSAALKFVLFSLLVFAMGGMVFMDSTGMVTKGFGQNHLVTYKGGKISAMDFNYLMQDNLKQQRISELDAYRYGFAQQILENEIDKIIITKAARDAGLVIGDKQAAIQVRGIIAPLIEQGANEKEALDYVLRQTGTNQIGFLNMIKQHLSKQMLSAVVLSNAQVSDDLVKELAIYENAQRKGNYIELTFNDIGKVSAPTEEEIQDFYNRTSYEYQTPEYRDFSVVVINKDVLGINVEVTEAQVRKAYDENIENFITPASRDIAQILIKDKNTADKIYEEAKTSADIKSLADKYEAKFMPATNFTQEALPKELAEASFSAKKAEVIEPIETPLGWHILKIEKINEEKITSFNEAKKDLKEHLEKSSILEHLYDLANRVDDAVAGGASLMEIAEAHALNMIEFKSVASDKLPDSKKVPEFERVATVAFAMPAGEVSNLIETKSGDFVLVETHSITNPQTIPLEKVKDKVKKQLITQKQLRMLADKTSEVLQKLQDGEKINKIAQSLNKSVKSTGFIKRTSSDEKINPNLVKALFSLNKDNKFTSVTSGNEAISILVLDEEKLTPYDKINEAEKTRIKNALAIDYQEDVFTQYRNQLKNKYKVKVNYNLFEKMYEDAVSRSEQQSE